MRQSAPWFKGSAVMNRFCDFLDGIIFYRDQNEVGFGKVSQEILSPSFVNKRDFSFSQTGA